MDRQNRTWRRTTCTVRAQEAGLDVCSPRRHRERSMGNVALAKGVHSHLRPPFLSAHGERRRVIGRPGQMSTACSHDNSSLVQHIWKIEPQEVRPVGCARAARITAAALTA